MKLRVTSRQTGTNVRYSVENIFIVFDKLIAIQDDGSRLSWTIPNNDYDFQVEE